MISVASYRLAIHLGLAFVILGLIAWYVLRLGRPEAELLQARRQRSEPLMPGAPRWSPSPSSRSLLGALVAGIDAGRSYTDWPLMGGEVVPSGALRLSPAWRNFLDNPALVQFNHRLVGYLLLALGLAAWLRARRERARPRPRRLRGDDRHARAPGRARHRHRAPRRAAAASPSSTSSARSPLFTLILRARFAALYPRPERIARA